MINPLIKIRVIVVSQIGRRAEESAPRGMVFKSVAGSEDTRQENHIHPVLMKSRLACTVLSRQTLATPAW